MMARSNIEISGARSCQVSSSVDNELRNTACSCILICFITVCPYAVRKKSRLFTSTGYVCTALVRNLRLRRNPSHV